MKRKTIFLTALLLTVPFTFGLTGCSANSQSPEKDNSGSIQNTAEPAADIQFEHMQENGSEYARVTAYDKNHTEIWNYTTDSYLSTELTQVQEFGQTEDCYYLNESGTVIALDKNTGNILWSNSDFGGAGGDAFVDEDGTLYCCGYYGPDFCAINPDGSTLKIIETFDIDYIWASQIEREGDYIAVTMEGGETENQQDPYVFYVDPEDFSYFQKGAE